MSTITPMPFVGAAVLVVFNSVSAAVFLKKKKTNY